MTAERLTMLANPARDQEAEAFRRAVIATGAALEQLTASNPSEIDDVVRRAADSGADVVASVGGDGTQRTVGAALAGSATRLGVVPGGTVNLLAQVLGLDSLDAAVSAITSGRHRAIDVGRSNDNSFLLNTSSGYDADVIERADAGNKERWGRLSFVAAAVSALRAARPARVVVTVDGDSVFAGRALSVIVTNAPARSSGDFTIAPDARMDDGVLDLMIVRADTALGLARILRSLAFDRSPSPSDLLRSRGSHLLVEWARPMVSQLDGDANERSRRFDVTVHPAALRVCIDPAAP